MTRADADAALARYLATRLMGSWVAYQGRGLRSVLASLASAYILTAVAMSSGMWKDATLGHVTSSIRATDWLLLHLLDRQEWAGWCSDWEGAPDASQLLALVAGASALLDGLSWATPAP